METLINIDIPELQSAIDFYYAMLGTTHTRTLEDVAELTGGSSIIYLLKHTAGSASCRCIDPSDGHAATRSYQRHWTSVHIDFLLKTSSQLKLVHWPLEQKKKASA